ncbi:tRNA (adenosine(37)-N6)-threonylcarbamoyltransferase complex dimerization subunit type 1 TsaB [Geminicoccaceae bacterium 1502E]|nr:tRNA (adenosine(37)-N6)-threonylcarbamoyltransferase complex dimerization subunit type 1 TsaB [Geminicoccaceae bacterium 1502E]
MQRLLAIDTTGADASVAVVTAGKTHALRELPAATGLADVLLPAIEAVLAEARASWGDLDLLVVVTGPGGFTGVRAGVAVTRALALAAGLQVLPVTRLAAVAEGWSREGGIFPCLVALDVRRGELVAQRFENPGMPAGEPVTAGVAEIARHAAEEEAVLVGDGAALLGAEPGRGRAGAINAAHAALRALAQGAVPVAGDAVLPFYARAADARPGAGAALVTAA